MPEMTQDERKLNIELNRLVKQANRRLLAIEKETHVKEGFASKQLYDYLSASPIGAITKGKRISLKSDYTLMQKQAIIKAINKFIDSTSTISKIKAYQIKYSNIAGKKLSYKLADTYYKVTHNFDWLWETGIVESDFWKIYSTKVATMDKESWTELVGGHMTRAIDRTIKRNLEILYDYLKG